MEEKKPLVIDAGTVRGIAVTTASIKGEVEAAGPSPRNLPTPAGDDDDHGAPSPGGRDDRGAPSPGSRDDDDGAPSPG